MSVCDEIEGSRFRLTALGEHLRPNHPDSVEARVLLYGQVFMPAEDETRERFRFFDTVSRDLIMLSVNGTGGGRVRTRSEFRDLLAAAGFEMTAVIPSSGAVNVVEARPV
jgi:hypothetical protein